MTSSDFTTPTAGEKPSRRRGLSGRSLALLVVLTLVVGVGGTVLVLFATGAFSTEIRAEPIQNPGENPFMPPVGVDQPVVMRPPKVGGPVAGGTSGLYGGTLNNSSCDPAKMVAFLRANPEKANAWAGVLGVRPADIPGYVAELTPLILRADTAVTNHGFARGKATTIHSVLQAGTAVLVDKFGTPRVRCGCGNPLTPPTSFSKPRYVGPVWPGFSQVNTVVVQPGTVVINEFVIIDLRTSAVIYRPAGTTGDRDRGDLKDASIDGEYLLQRTLVNCSALDECRTSPLPVRIDCSSPGQCTITRLDGVWLQSHSLTFDGNVTYRLSAADDGASRCDDAATGPPITGVTIMLELTVTEAAAVDGVWRAQAFTGSYRVVSPGTVCSDGPTTGGEAAFDLST